MNFEKDPLKNLDGSWKYTNGLVDASSSFLQRHAHEPVKWYQWGQEALSLAKKQDKPIFLTIGYLASCDYHIMAKQVFVQEHIASIMNENFINIMVDKEERPDIDEVYMAARQIMTHDGGWPNNVFLTADLEPFFAGGVFYIDERAGSIAFDELLMMLRDSWQSKRQHIEHTGAYIKRAVVQNLTNEKKQKLPNIAYTEMISMLLRQLMHFADHKHGGFFNVPKFPHENHLLFLLEYYQQSHDYDVQQLLTTTLDKMSEGGICDQINGGFYRYAVDQKWHVPHFEKMLYTQALLVKVYARAGELLSSQYYLDIAKQTADFVLAHMTSKNALFNASIDVNNVQSKDDCSTWTREQISSILTPGEYAVFNDYYQLAVISKNNDNKPVNAGVICRIKQPLSTEKQVKEKLQRIRQKLLQAKAKQISSDATTITAWHAMMITALAYLGKALSNEEYLTLAQKSARAMLKHLIDQKGDMCRVFQDGKANGHAFLEDYAFAIEAMLTLYDATGKKTWCDKATALNKKVYDLFWGEDANSYYFSDGKERNIVRMSVGSDGAVVADNAVMLHNIINLASATGKQLDLGHIKNVITSFYTDMALSPMAHSHMIHTLLKLPDLDISRVDPLAINAVDSVANDNNQDSAQVVSAQIMPIKPLKAGVQRVEFVVRIVVDDDWNIQANPATLNYLIPTHLVIRENSTIALKEVEYPAHHEVSFADSSIIHVYSQTVDILAVAECQKPVKSGQTIPLKAQLIVQACAGGVFLSPSNIEITANIDVK